MTDLNHITLPLTMVAELYRTSLIDGGEPGDLILNSPTPKPAEPDNKEWIRLGNNNKNILVIVKYEQVVHLPPAELKFLNGILRACKLEQDDVTIINLNNHPTVGYKELTTEFKTKIVLLFNVEPSRLNLPMNFPHYQLQAFANNTFLSAPALVELEENTMLKSRLWVCLRRLFNI